MAELADPLRSLVHRSLRTADCRRRRRRRTTMTNARWHAAVAPTTITVCRTATAAAAAPHTTRTTSAGDGRQQQVRSEDGSFSGAKQTGQDMQTNPILIGNTHYLFGFFLLIPS